EDGIRDLIVTGVQTCALPIYRWLALARRTRELLDTAIGEGSLPDGGAAYLSDRTLPHVEGVRNGFLGWLRSEMADVAELRYLLRSEERRVGKEWRCRGSWWSL